MEIEVKFKIDIENPKDLHADELYPIHWMVENPKRVFEMLETLLLGGLSNVELYQHAANYQVDIDSGISEMLANREQDARAE